MACFRPIDAWQQDSGAVVFAERGKVRRALQLPCGQCTGCRLERSRMWAIRCMHEAAMHTESSFVTLTYAPEHVPAGGTLVYRDWQLFMKRLRKKQGAVRFYMCGEYGETFYRPHFHGCLFGASFADRVLFKRLPSGSNLYTSDALGTLWPFGFSSIGDVTFESAAYVARYIMKKVTGPQSEQHYTRIDPQTGEILQVQPEFNRMSLKPGIGADWFDKYRADVYTTDNVIVNGIKCKAPKYYDRRLKKTDAFASDELEYGRYLKAVAGAADSTPERLAVREQVAIARLKFKKRTME